MDRSIRIEVVLDPDAHGVVQLAVMAFLRRRAGSLAPLEDLRLALDEVLLHDAVLAEPSIAVAVRTDDGGVDVEVVLRDHDLVVDEEVVRVLVDGFVVERRDGESVVRFGRRWPPTR